MPVALIAARQCSQGVRCLRVEPTSVSLAWYSARRPSMALKALRKLSASTRSADTLSPAASAAERDRASSAYTNTHKQISVLAYAHNGMCQATPSSKLFLHMDLPRIDCQLHISWPCFLSHIDCPGLPGGFALFCWTPVLRLAPAALLPAQLQPRLLLLLPLQHGMPRRPAGQSTPATDNTNLVKLLY